jgi:hypothetical protein
MGERLDSLEKSTAQEKDGEELDEKTFLDLSQSLEGLTNIPEDTLEKFLYTRDNIEDITYIFKFITNEEMYLKIVTEESSSFDKLGEEEQIEVRELASLFHSFLTEVPIFCENTSINLNEEGTFIAYINKRIKRLGLSWKNEKGDNHIFNKLLEKANSKDEDYLNTLRSWGKLRIYLDQEDFVNIEFSGDASKKYLAYAPGYLKNFEGELKEFFVKKFERERIKIHF